MCLAGRVIRMNRVLLFLFVTTGIVGAALLVLSVLACNEASMNMGLISILSSAVLLIATVVLGRLNCCWQTRIHGKAVPNWAKAKPRWITKPANLGYKHDPTSAGFLIAEKQMATQALHLCLKVKERPVPGVQGVCRGMRRGFRSDKTQACVSSSEYK